MHKIIPLLCPFNVEYEGYLLNSLCILHKLHFVTPPEIVAQNLASHI